jgi:hypothetical protein
MGENEISLSMSVPLDSDGFLRRECPTCEREFKWIHTPPNESAGPAAPVADGGYFCPYCGVQAPTNAWLTKAQVALAQNAVAAEAVAPLLEDFSRSLGRIGRSSGGTVSAKARYNPPEKMDPLTEGDDMKRVDFSCHPAEPVKILDDGIGLCTASCAEPRRPPNQGRDRAPSRQTRLHPA